MDHRPRPRTISDLAERLGVSPMTVHRAIAGKPDISAETRRRILAEVERIGWRPNIAARGLRQRKTFTLGILVSNVAASFLPEVLQGLNRTAEAHGCHTFVSVHEHDVTRARRHLQTLESKGVDGIVHYPTDSGEEVEILNQVYRSMPVVAVMRELAGFEGPTVLVDDYRGGELAGEHLCWLGHRRIAFLGYAGSQFAQRRLQGFTAELARHGVELRPEWCVGDLAPGDPRAAVEARRLLELRERPTAFFCVSDRLAARATQGAAAAGLSVPGDVSIIGYNDDPLAVLLPAPLTTIAQPRLAVGEEAARVVLATDFVERAGARLVLEPRLVVRESTAVSGI